MILILLESVRGFEGGLVTPGASSPVAPNLSRLVEEGLIFPNVYFNASQTAPAEVATLCSLLPDPTAEIVYLHAPALSVACLPEILRNAGYSTLWMNAYRSDFSNANGFLSTHGFTKMFDEHEIRAWGPRRPPIGWGIADEDLFDFALGEIDRTEEPFLAEILTMSNHAPWRTAEFPLSTPDVIRQGPGPEDYRGYRFGIYYTDYAVGRFLEAARGRPWFANTVFVILGDHGMWVFPENSGDASTSFLDKTELYMRAGMVVWSPGLIEPGRNDTLGSQIDVVPTILDLLGIAAPNSFQGVSLLASEIPQEERFAIHVGKSSWHIRRGARYCYALGQSCFDAADPSCPPGVQPQASSHACFAFEGDLLSSPSPRADLRLLDPTEQSRLVSFGQRLLDDTGFLIRNDSLFPAKRRRAAGRPTLALHSR